MGFWGIEVKPGTEYALQSDEFEGRLHITRATLGLGESKERTIVQCAVGSNSPVFLCSLLPRKNESCHLNLVFEGDSGLVSFSVIGKRSIHLSGFFVEDGGEDGDEYESDPFGEDIAETESESSDYDTEDDTDDEDGFIDDEDIDMFPHSPAPKSGVVIEEIEDDEKPTHGNSQSKRLLKKNQSSVSEDNTNSQKQIVVKKSDDVPVLESEDEDGFPISTKEKSSSNTEKPDATTEQRDNKITEKTKKKKVKDGEDAAGMKRKVEDVDQDGQPEREKKNKKKKLKEQTSEGNADEINACTDNEKQSEIPKSQGTNQKSSDTEEKQTKKKKKKKNKKNKKSQESETKTDIDQSQTVAKPEDENEPALGKTNGKKSKVRTYPNGLVIEDLAMGKPDGKRASPGQTVSVRYIGKLKNGTIFDSNVGGPPFKFRLGVGQVIQGWDVGVTGMRIGDKRRLTVPPAMGYGQKRAGKIPPNSWLVFDVELLGVN